MKKTAALLLAAILLLGVFCSTAHAAEVKELIEEMVKVYSKGGDYANRKASEKLASIKRKAPEKGLRWEQMMKFWGYTREMEIHRNMLPDGLPEDDSLCIVVLGFELYPDGSMKDELLARLHVALTCAWQYPNAYVLCTGGGTAMNEPTMTEALAMSRWLISKGIDENRVIVEDQSLSTTQNAVNSAAIIRERYPQITSVVIVSSAYHVPWGAAVFQAAFLKEAADPEHPARSVVSNAACDITNDAYHNVEPFIANGVLAILGT